MADLRLLPDAAFAPYQLLRALGSRPAGVYVVRHAAAPGGKPQLVVAEHFSGLAKGADGPESDFLLEARRIAAVRNPNLTRVRDIVVHGSDVAVYGEWLDGEKLADVWCARGGGLPLEVALRVIVDAISGVGALHALRDNLGQPMKLAHGELSPATVALGLDGVARVLHAIARRAPGVRPDPASVGYMAPEVLAGESYDQRADVFGAGALLWEALSGGPLFPEQDPAKIRARIREGPLPRASVPDEAPWARGLVDVAARALAASADERWPTVTAMAFEVRKEAGLKIAPASTAAALAKRTMAERSKTRREKLETMPALPDAPRAEPPAQAIPVHVSTWPAPALPTERDIPAAPVIPSETTDLVEFVEALDSVPPPASGGFLLDATAVSARLAQPRATPPELPAPPVVVASPAPAPLSPTPSPSKEASPAPPTRALQESAPSVVKGTDARPRRKTVVLVSLGALGAVVLGFGLVRFVLHAEKAPETPAPAASSAPVATRAPPPSATAEPSSPFAPSAPLPSAAPNAPPSAAVSEPPTPMPPAPTVPMPIPANPQPAAARPAPAPAPPAKKPKPTFHPDSL